MVAKQQHTEEPFAKAKRLIEAAEALADAGAKLIVLEKITEES